MREEFSRTALLIGKSGLEKLKNAHIALFGVGGVGGFTAEALIRSGVGALDIFDNDTVSVSNINRQLIALHSTVGRLKVDVMKERLLDINPEAEIGAYAMFYLPENADSVDLSKYDYIIDAIDTVSAKIELAVRAAALNIPIISAMGAGNKLDPTAFEVTDISKTSVCPLARVMRQSLKKRGVNHLKVVYSREIPREHAEDVECPPQEGRRSTPGSTAFCPSVAGLIIAGAAIQDLVGFS